MTTSDDFDAMVDAALAPLDLDVETSTEEERERWRIDGERTAAWAVRRLRAAAEERERAHALADDLRAQADAYIEAVDKRLDHDEQFFTAKLREWVVELRKKEPKRKTFDVPGAKLSTSLGSVKTDLPAEKVKDAVEWLEDHDPDCIRPKDPEVALAEVKKRYGEKIADEPGRYPAVNADGEAVPGVEFVRGVETFTVKFVDAPEATDEEAPDA